MKPEERYKIRYARKAYRKRLAEELWERSRVCYLCGREINRAFTEPDPRCMEIDEVIPITKGGDPNDINNLRLTHKRCNQLKMNDTVAEGIARVRASIPGATVGNIVRIDPEEF